MKIETFIEASGGIKEAAKILGVHWVTLYGWLNKRSKPRGLSAQALSSRKITL